MSKTFCILPWIHMFISTTGTYRPCCVSSEFSNRHKVFEESPEDYLNSEDVKNLRKQLLNNEKPNICKTCWDKEEKGNNYSKRLGELQIWKHINTDELIENTNEDGSY